MKKNQNFCRNHWISPDHENFTFDLPKTFPENPKLEKPLQKEQILVPLVEKLPSCSNNDSSHVKFTLLSRDMHLRINMFINQKLVKYLPEVVYPNSYPKNNS